MVSPVVGWTSERSAACSANRGAPLLSGMLRPLVLPRVRPAGGA
jgi:hypothetical protein